MHRLKIKLFSLLLFFFLTGCGVFNDNFIEVSRKGMICNKNYSFSDVTITNIEVGCTGSNCVSSFLISSSGTNKSFKLNYDGDLSKIKNYSEVSVSIKNCYFATSVSENWTFFGVVFWFFIVPFMFLFIFGLFGKSKSDIPPTK